MAPNIRLAIVDDHPLFIEGVVTALKAARDIDVVGQGHCAADAVRLAESLAPDVLILDINIPGDGLAAAQYLWASRTATKMVILSVSEDEANVTGAMKAGASGYIVKGVSGLELTRAVREIHRGARYVSPSLAARILAAPSTASATPENERLTQRERDVMAHVARGLTNKEVARELSLSDKTVKYYMTSIMQKLRLRNRMEVVLWATGDRDTGSSAAPADVSSPRAPSTSLRWGGELKSSGK
ncbi:MAG: response regulator transcription factor [Hyphomicrobiaceae bacterium]|nr:response regulator transcription factor [Hyphomicrobiaceae bacterium]